MAIQLENPHGGEFILREVDAEISRDEITLASGQSLLAGAVLGAIAASGKYKEFDPAAVDGSQTAAAILFAETDASAGDKKTVAVARLAAIKSASLLWKTGVTDNQKAAALASLATKFLIAR